MIAFQADLHKIISVFGFAGCKADLDLVFLIDSSGSVNITDYLLLKQFVADTINRLPQSGTRVGAALFSDRTEHLFYLYTYTSLYQASSAVLAAPHLADATNIAGALNYARSVLFTPFRGDRHGVQNLVILLTDGDANRDERLTVSSAQQLHGTGAQVICIGITYGVSEIELSQISSPPHIKGRNYLRIGDFVSLTSNVNTLLSLINSWQTISTFTTAVTHGRLKILVLLVDFYICFLLSTDLLHLDLLYIIIKLILLSN